MARKFKGDKPPSDTIPDAQAVKDIASSLGAVLGRALDGKSSREVGKTGDIPLPVRETGVPFTDLRIRDLEARVMAYHRGEDPNKPRRRTVLIRR